MSRDVVKDDEVRDDEVRGAGRDVEDVKDNDVGRDVGVKGDDNIVPLPNKFNAIFKNLTELVKYRGDDADMFEKSIQLLLRNKLSIEMPNGKVPRIPRLYGKDICVLLMVDTKQEYKKALMSHIKIVLSDPTPDRLSEFLDEYDNKKQYVFVFLKGKHISKSDENVINNFDKLLLKAGCMLHHFTDSNFFINPMEHIYVPRHRKCSKEEEPKIMQKYMITSKSKMPVILNSDIISKWIGLKTGDIVEITRSNATSGTTLFYRVCV